MGEESLSWMPDTPVPHAAHFCYTWAEDMFTVSKLTEKIFINLSLFSNKIIVTYQIKKKKTT